MPSAFAADSRSSSRRQPSPRTCTSENDSGRPDVSGHAPEDRELGVEVGEVGHDLQHSLPRPADRLRDPDQLVGLRGQCGRVLAFAGAVIERPRRREAEGSGLDCLAVRVEPSRRCRARVATSRLAPRSPITCNRSAPCGTWTATSTSNGRSPSASMNSGNDCQSPREAFVQDRARDVFHTFHQLDEPIVISGTHRGEADAAVAHHHGRDTVPGRRDHALAPRRLPVVVTMDVDEARRDEKTVGVDRARRLARRLCRPR